MGREESSKMLSDHDTDSSTAGASPQSFVESPYSSPSQQVPQLTYNMTVLSCTEGNLTDTGPGNDGPFLSITEQPSDHFRFRYRSEMVGTHGCLIGKSSASNRSKTYPSVEYNNGEDHPHQLVEDEQEKDLSAEVGPQKGYQVRFQGMGIIHTAKKDVPAVLYKRFSERLTNFNVKELKTQCENIAKGINLNIVRLKFTAHDIRTDAEICAPAFSEPINNMKSAATNDLKICRMSRTVGRASGGDDVYILTEKVNKKSAATNDLKICRMSRTVGRASGGDDVYILTEKVNKKNIDILLVEMVQGEVVWEGRGRFLQSDVHHQYAIFFRTPPYRDPRTPVDVKVYVQLVRPSDGRRSEGLEFVYKAEDAHKQNKKRKADSYNSVGSNSGGSIKSYSDLPEAVIMVNQINGHENKIPIDIEIPLAPNIQVGGESELSQALFECAVLGPARAPLLSAPNVPGPPEIHLGSGDLDQLLTANNVPDDEMRMFADNFSGECLNEYFKPFEKMLSGGGDSLLSYIHGSGKLKPDSGRAQGIPKRPSSSEVKPNSAPNPTPPLRGGWTPMDIKEEKGYTACYTQKDGVEVKKLVKELCEIIRNKQEYKKQVVRAKLDRLFELRLSNGDTFLHMTLCNNILPSMEYIVKLIHSLKMTHLLNEQNDKLQTILHLAIVNDLPQHIPFLISKGCNPMLEDEEGNNAVHYCVKCQSCLEPLLDSVRASNVHCDLNACNKEKQTALHLAAIYGSGSSAALLVRAGASYSARDNVGRTPLHIADASSSVVSALLQYIPTSDVDSVDGRGHTALQIVCGSQRTPATLDIVQLLLQKGADPFKSGETSDSAWRLARKSPEILGVMRQYVDDSELMLEDEIKSEPEDEADYESAEEGEPDTGLEAMSAYIHELAALLDRSGGWRLLAQRLHCESLLNWFSNTPSPTRTLLAQVKECQQDVTSHSLAKILRDVGEFEAADVILRYVDV